MISSHPAYAQYNYRYDGSGAIYVNPSTMATDIRNNSMLRHVEINIRGFTVKDLECILVNNSIISLDCGLCLRLGESIPTDCRLRGLTITYAEVFRKLKRTVRFCRNHNMTLLPLHMHLQRLSLDLDGMQHLKFPIHDVAHTLGTNLTLREIELRKIGNNQITHCLLRVLRHHASITDVVLHGELPTRDIFLIIGNTHHIQSLHCVWYVDRKTNVVFRQRAEYVLKEILPALAYNASIKRFCFTYRQYQTMKDPELGMFDFLRYNTTLTKFDLCMFCTGNKDPYLNPYWQQELLHVLMWNSTLTESIY